MTKNFPTLYGLSIENIKEKIMFYDSVGLHNIAILHPTYLMQSVELSYARYYFYKSNNVIINMKNYSKLFLSEKAIKKQYGVTNKDLISLYNYNEKHLKIKKKN